VVYGDITQQNVLQHAGVDRARIVICSLPNTVLKGASNMKLLRLVRALNPRARIVVHAEQLSEIPALYSAGADFVSAPRLLEARELLHVLEAAEKDLLDQTKAEQAEHLHERSEVIP